MRLDGDFVAARVGVTPATRSTMENGNKFDVRALFRLPQIAMPAKFCARVTMAAIWGCLLGQGMGSGRLACGAVLGLLAGLLSVSFFGWDRRRLDGTRMALYGLYVAGEMLVVGTLVMAALATFSGAVYGYAMMLSGFGGSLFTVYSTFLLMTRNITEVGDQSR
jgi:hypothetical protein